MEEKRYNIVLPDGCSKDGKIEIVIRETDTVNEVPVRDSFRRIDLDVTLPSVGEFIRKYISVGAYQGALLRFGVEPDNAFLEFLENPANIDSARVAAKLTKHPDLLAWRINNDNSPFTQKEFISLIRKKGYMMGSPDIAEGLIKKLQNFEVKFDASMKQADDRQGSKEQAFKETLRFVSGEIEKEFTLLTPLFHGTKPQPINVAVEIDRGPNNLPVFSFFCIDLEARLRLESETYIRSEIEPYRDTAITIVQA